MFDGRRGVESVGIWKGGRGRWMKEKEGQGRWMEKKRGRVKIEMEGRGSYKFVGFLVLPETREFETQSEGSS